MRTSVRRVSLERVEVTIPSVFSHVSDDSSSAVESLVNHLTDFAPAVIGSGSEMVIVGQWLTS